MSEVGQRAGAGAPADGLPLPAPTRSRRPDRIEIRGLRLTGTHGVLPEERERAQPFEIDLDIEIDLRRAGRSDALGDTADYGAVAEAVARVVGGPHVQLLEHLAEQIVGATFASAPLAGAASVSVRKLRPPVPYEMASAGVTIYRRRDDQEAGRAGSASRPIPGSPIPAVQASTKRPRRVLD